MKGANGNDGNDGEDGKAGNDGKPGNDGEDGKPGADAKAGSQFLSGVNKPDITTDGKVGDFYFQTSTLELFGPKTSSGWGLGVSLKGDKGDPGTANVMSSGWIDFECKIAAPANTSARMEYTLSREVANVIGDAGLIMFYKQSDPNVGGFYTHPFPGVPFYNVEGSYFINERFANSYIVFELKSLDNDEIKPFHLQYWFRFRYVVIPKGVSISKANPNPTIEDWKKLSFEQVQKVLSLKK